MLLITFSLFYSGKVYITIVYIPTISPCLTWFSGVVSHVQALAQGDQGAGWAEEQDEAEKPSQDSLQALASKIMKSTLTAHSATPIGISLLVLDCFESSVRVAGFRRRRRVERAL